LLNLINQIDGANIKVWDDYSDFKIEYLLKWNNKITFYQFQKNHGKKQAWKKFRDIFKRMPRGYDYYIFLPDDVELCEDFIYKAIETWESIKHEKKICLSFSDVERTKKPNWTDFNAVDCGNVIMTQWTDLMFICEERFFDLVEVAEVCETRWKFDDLLGSGVGSVISNHFHKMGLTMYNTKENLLKHIGNDDSKMNPVIRKKQRL
jgi:hypothetical protein